MKKLPPTFSRKSRSASGSIPIRRGDESSNFAEIEHFSSSKAIQAATAAKEDLHAPGDEPNVPGIPVQPALARMAEEGCFMPLLFSGQVITARVVGQKEVASIPRKQKWNIAIPRRMKFLATSTLGNRSRCRRLRFEFQYRCNSASQEEIFVVQLRAIQLKQAETIASFKNEFSRPRSPVAVNCPVFPPFSILSATGILEEAQRDPWHIACLISCI
eukprot:IDg7280t1